MGHSRLPGMPLTTDDEMRDWPTLLLFMLRYRCPVNENDGWDMEKGQLKVLGPIIIFLYHIYVGEDAPGG